MRSFLHSLKNILSTKWATAFIILGAIASRTIHLIFFFSLRVDRSYQLLATQNFVHGDGISTASVTPADLASTIYSPLIKWPPGYSLLVSPFYSITGNNYLLSTLFLDIVFGIILILVSRAILKLLNTPLFLVNIYTIVSSLFIYYFYFITSSDAIASTFFILALYYTLAFFKNKLSLLKAVILISLFLFACAFMKYLFMPAVFVIPLYIAWKGFIDKNKKQLRTGILSALIIALGLISVLVYQKSISGSSTYASEAPRGIFTENLLSAYPIIPAAIVKPDTIGLVFGAAFTESRVLSVFKIVYVFSLIAILIWLIRSFIKTRFRNASLLTDFFYITAGTSLATILLLAFLSLRIAKDEDVPGHLWTFIQEPRYYSLTNILIHIGIFVFYQVYKKRNDKLARLVFYFLLLSLLPELFRGTLFTAKRVVSVGKQEYIWQTDLKIQQFADAIINKGKEKQSINKALVTGSSYFLNNRISLYSHIPILNEAEKINTPALLNTKEKVLVLVIIHEKDFSAFQPFLSNPDKEVAGSMKGFYFYTLYVAPH